ncbi:MAG TPA: replicative helicase loader/inhibitor [Propionibacteriaceae bacterium]|nr:replicative helicase loader/inhibitor [Propionibacteriaceae bacterium]
MTPQETARLMGVFAAAWPNQEISRDTVELWSGMLERVNVEHAMAAAKVLIRNENWLPTIAKFLQAVETEASYQRARLARTRGLPGARTVSAPPNRALMAATRGMLAEQRSKKHWHGGPDPCPACGGMKGRPSNGRLEGIADEAGGLIEAGIGRPDHVIEDEF